VVYSLLYRGRPERQSAAATASGSAPEPAAG
jgi:hypothetical protein